MAENCEKASDRLALIYRDWALERGLKAERTEAPLDLLQVFNYVEHRR